MLSRILLIFGLLLAFTLIVEWCNPHFDYYTSMQVQKVDGQPYLILENVSTSTESTDAFFSIYKPGANGASEWTPVATDRLGHALGIFRVQAGAASTPVTAPPATIETPAKTDSPAKTDPPAKSDTPAPETPPAKPKELPSTVTRLGIFHGDGATTLLDLSANPAKSEFKHVSFNWVPLTCAELNGTYYAFGIDRFEQNDKRTEVPVRVARLDGDTWTDLKIAGPGVKLNQLKAFSLDALTINNSIKVLWRGAVEDQSLIEGQRLTTDGPLNISSFDGKNFARKSEEKDADAQVVNVPKLPKGNASLWVEGDTIRALIQTRPKEEQSLAVNSPMEIWTIQADGDAQMAERLEGSQSKPGLMAFIAAEHFTDKDQEYILRSNWQSFEVWQRANGTWKMIRANPTGLPAYDLESVLWTALAIAGSLVLFGAFLAWRRRQAWTLMRRIQAHEIYATIGSRTGAYLVDIGLIVAASILFSKVYGHYANPIDMVFIDFSRMPYWPFFGIYMLYFSLCEWLFGTTVGKLMMGLCVVQDGGQKLSLSLAVVRNLVGFVERIPGIVLVIVWPMILLTPRRQRLGDMLSRSFVVHKSALEIFKQQREQELAKMRSDALAAGTIEGKPEEPKNRQP